MKKLLLLTAALLPGLLAHSQEAEDLGSSYAEVSVVARAEFSSDEELHHLGNSSFYALLEGAFSPKLSYYVQAHLLCCVPSYLYKNTLYSNSTNWLDYAYLDYEFSQFDVLLGKTCLAFANCEFDLDDFDINYETASTFWLNMPAYQWGAQFSWNHDDFTLSAQAATSPFGERPFASGKFAYSLKYSVDYREHFNDQYSFNFIQRPDGSFLKLFCVGLDFQTGKWNFILDGSFDLFTYKIPNCKSFQATYTLDDKWSFMARVGWDNMGEEWEKSDNRFYGGLRAFWNPIEQLRVHALAGFDSIINAPTFNIGLTWKMSL